MKSVDIKFGLPQGMKGFQKSFYENYIKEKANSKKSTKVIPREYIAFQEQFKKHIENPHSNVVKS